MSFIESTVTFQVERVEAETDKALLVDIEGEKVWVPKSMIADESEVFSKEHGDGDLIVSAWWAERRGLV